MNRMPWEKRLEDLAHHLNCCAETYFEPELFRRNVNNFLQTARTVTFIIQKNKSEIEEFEEWYSENVIEAWKNDEIMQWAKEARNQIEKQGDLDLYSTVSASLIFSYLDEEDIRLHCKHEELIGCGIKKLIRLAQKQLPSGVMKESSLKIERKWVTSKLESYELLYALCYVYSRQFDCVEKLARHQERDLPSSLPNKSDAYQYIELSCQIQYVKIKDNSTYRLRSQKVSREPYESLPSKIKDCLANIREELITPTSFESVLEFHIQMAKSTFSTWENHVSMLFLYNSEWQVIDMICHAPADQADKYFFWRALGERVKIQSVYCLVYVSEVWIRDLKGYPSLAIKDLPIIGEKLHVSALDRSGNKAIISWDIIRESATGSVVLGNKSEDYTTDNQMYYFVPAMKSMGLEINLQER